MIRSGMLMDTDCWVPAPMVQLIEYSPALYSTLPNVPTLGTEWVASWTMEALAPVSDQPASEVSNDGLVQRFSRSGCTVTNTWRGGWNALGTTPVVPLIMANSSCTLVRF